MSLYHKIRKWSRSPSSQLQSAPRPSGAIARAHPVMENSNSLLEDILRGCVHYGVYGVILYVPWSSLMGCIWMHDHPITGILDQWIEQHPSMTRCPSPIGTWKRSVTFQLQPHNLLGGHITTHETPKPTVSLLPSCCSCNGKMKDLRIHV